MDNNLSIQYMYLDTDPLSNVLVNYVTCFESVSNANIYSGAAKLNIIFLQLSPTAILTKLLITDEYLEADQCSAC